LYQPEAKAFSEAVLLVFANEEELKRRPANVALARAADAAREIMFSSM
jgi:hypothetical protein